VDVKAYLEFYNEGFGEMMMLTFWEGGLMKDTEVMLRLLSQLPTPTHQAGLGDIDTGPSFSFP
jgi:hypothetical protein